MFTLLPNLHLRLNSNFRLPDINETYKLTAFAVDEVLDQDSINNLRIKNLLKDVRNIQIFSSPSFYTGNIHIDGTDPYTQEGAINWVCNDTDQSYWSTQWGQAKKLVKETSNKSNPGSALYYDAKNFDITTEWHGPCSIPALIHVGIPHRIVNKSNHIRHCVSVRFNNKHGYYSLKEILTD